MTNNHFALFLNIISSIFATSSWQLQQFENYKSQNVQQKMKLTLLSSETGQTKACSRKNSSKTATVTALKSRNLVVKKSFSEQISDQAQCPAQPLISTQHKLSNFSEFFFMEHLFKIDQMVYKLKPDISRLAQPFTDYS